MFYEPTLNEGPSQLEKARLDRSLIYPIKDSNILLNDSSHQKYFEKLKTLSMHELENRMESFDEYFFNALFKDLIHNFVNYVQSLPDKTGRDFYVNTALLRALWALESYLKKTERESRNDGDIFPYAIFSAALLSQIGEIYSEIQIQLVDERGVYKANWNPLDGPMTNFNCEWFRQRNVPKHSQSMINHLTVNIATRIIPDIGYKWISQDRKVLEWWYDSLIDQHEKLGQFDIDVNLEKDFVARSRLEPIDIQGLMPDDLIKADVLAEWIKKQAEDLQKQNIKNANSYVTKNGFLISEKLLKEFAESQKHTVDDVAKYLVESGIASGQPHIEEFLIKHSGGSQTLFSGGGSINNELVKGVMINRQFANLKKQTNIMSVVSQSVGGFIARFVESQENERENKLDSKRSPGKTGV